MVRTNKNMMCATYVILSVFWRLTCRGIRLLDNTRPLRASGVRPCPVVSLRIVNGLVFGPFYGEVQPQLLLGPRPLAGRLSPPARERIPRVLQARPTPPRSPGGPGESWRPSLPRPGAGWPGRSSRTPRRPSAPPSRSRLPRAGTRHLATPEHPELLGQLGGRRAPRMAIGTASRVRSVPRRFVSEINPSGSVTPQSPQIRARGVRCMYSPS
jgi:hypothetical protein